VKTALRYTAIHFLLTGTFREQVPEKINPL
jgi:hypothetical protein